MSKSFKIMCVNAGSSSIKFKLYQMEAQATQVKTIKEKSQFMSVLCSGLVERIGHDDAIFTLKKPGGYKNSKTLPIHNHDEGVQLVLNGLIEEKVIASLDEINGIGNRVVQGGKYFSDSALFNQDTYNKIEELIPLDPLHAEAHLTCFNAFKKALPNVGEVAVFDTAYHQTMEPKEFMYAIPYEWYEKYDVRRYGAHGTSHKYLAQYAKEEYFPNKEHVNIITCHVGSGASLAAIKDGKVIATSMGLTPLAGVMMGTRTGDIDPSCMPFLCKCTGLNADQVYDVYNHKSGLLGISCISNDTRDVETAYKNGDEKAKLAMDMYASRIAEYIMMYYGKLGHVDMIVCSAGVFENSAIYRKMAFDNVAEALGVKIDEALNKETVLGKEGLISSKESKIPVAVIPTDEELMIALDTVRILGL